MEFEEKCIKYEMTSGVTLTPSIFKRFTKINQILNSFKLLLILQTTN